MRERDRQREREILPSVMFYGGNAGHRGFFMRQKKEKCLKGSCDAGVEMCLILLERLGAVVDPEPVRSNTLFDQIISSSWAILEIIR